MRRFVYQLSNLDRQELYVGFTDRSLELTLQQIHHAPPMPISHWDLDSERVRFEVVERVDERSISVLFYASLWKSLKASNWKTVQCDLDRPGTAVKIPCGPDCGRHVTQ